MCFGANQSGLGCVWTDIAPNYSSSLNSIGRYYYSVFACVVAVEWLPSALLVDSGAFDPTRVGNFTSIA